MSRSLDLPSTEGVDTLAQELAKLQNNGKRRIAFLGSRHVPVVDIHLIELIARSLAEEGHTILTSGSQGVNAAVIRAVLGVTVGELIRRLDAKVICCPEKEQLLVETLSIGAMGVNSAMEFFRRRRNMAVVTGAERTDIQLAALEASTQCLILTGLGEPLLQLIHRAEELEVPILKVDLDTLASVEIIEQAFGHVRIHESIKASYAVQLVQEHVNLKNILETIDFPCNFSNKC